MVNALAGYQWKLTDRYRLDVQLNVENITNQLGQAEFARESVRLGNGYTGGGYIAPTKFILQTGVRF